MVLIHLLFLHQTGSNNPLGLNKNRDKISFHPYFTVKDILGFAVTIIILRVLTLKEPSRPAVPKFDFYLICKCPCERKKLFADIRQCTQKPYKATEFCPIRYIDL
jgi:hypothetical protein